MQKEKVALTLVGIKRFVSKKGNNVCLLSVSRPYTPEENDKGSFGAQISEEFVPQDQINDFGADDIGKIVEFEYGFNYYGRPEITRISVK